MCFVKLTDLPLVHVLDHLDKKSLNSLRATSNKLNVIVDRHRRRLAKNLRVEMQIYSTNKPECSEWLCTILTKVGTPKCCYLQWSDECCDDFDPKDIPVLLTTESKSAYFENLFESFIVDKIKFDFAHFTEENLRKMYNIFIGKTFRAREIEIVKPVIHDGDLIIDFINLFKPTVLKCNMLHIPGNRAPDNFVAMCSSLKKFNHIYPPMAQQRRFSCPVLPKLPTDFQRIPRYFFSGLVVEMEIETLRVAIQNWWNGDLSIQWWAVTLSGQYRNQALMASEFGLPFKVYGRLLVFRNPSNKVLSIDELYGNDCSLPLNHPYAVISIFEHAPQNGQ